MGFFAPGLLRFPKGSDSVVTFSMETTNDSLLWTIDQVADQFQVSTKAVSRLISNEQLPVVRIGRSIRIKRQAVHHFLEEQEHYNGHRAGLAVRHPQGERKCLSSANERKASSNERTARTGGHLSQAQAVKEFKALLGLPTRGKR